MAVTNQEVVKAHQEECLLNSNQDCTNPLKDNISPRVTFNPAINLVSKHNLDIKINHKVSQVNKPTQESSPKHKKWVVRNHLMEVKCHQAMWTTSKPESMH